MDNNHSFKNCWVPQSRIAITRPDLAVELTHIEEASLIIAESRRCGTLAGCAGRLGGGHNRSHDRRSQVGQIGGIHEQRVANVDGQTGGIETVPCSNSHGLVGWKNLRNH